MENRVPTRLWDAKGTAGDLALVGFLPTGPAGVWQLEGALVLGRIGGPADIQIPSGVVSAEHGQVAIVGNRVLYRDLNSTNGTWLAGKRLTDMTELAEGDALCFCMARKPEDVVYRLVLEPVQAQDFQWRQVPFDHEVAEVTFGRGTGDVNLADSYVSERHASFFRSSKGPYVIDHLSTNGVMLNGRAIEGMAPLATGDVVRIGQTLVYVLDDVLWVGESMAEEPVDEDEAQHTDDGTGLSAHGDETKEETPGSDTTATDESAMHTEPGSEDNKPDDEDKPNKTWRRKTEKRPSPNSLVIDIEKKDVWSRFKSKTILKDVRLSVEPGEFVLILGGSGAGKSTFLKAVMGESKAEGSIRLGDLDVYEEYEQIKNQIGYVPQQDLLRMNDTTYSTLLSAARLRMGSRHSRKEYREKTDWALALMGLSDMRKTMVGRLSGGERKRLSTAVELVGDPALFFLDEPDSGLDSDSASDLMKKLNSIAALGKMVLVISHSPDRAADLFSKVIVIGKSRRDGAGHLLFCGPVAEAKEFFEVDSLEDIVRRINHASDDGKGGVDYYLDKWEGE